MNWHFTMLWHKWYMYLSFLLISLNQVNILNFHRTVDWKNIHICYWSLALMFSGGLGWACTFGGVDLSGVTSFGRLPFISGHNFFGILSGGGYFQKFMLTHWLLELFAKNAFSGLFGGFRLDLGQVSFKLVENAFATRQLAFLATSIPFYDSLTQACAEIKILTYVFRLFHFWIFFFTFPFSPFLFFLLQ